jgi:hypothetical protein
VSARAAPAVQRGPAGSRRDRRVRGRQRTPGQLPARRARGRRPRSPPSREPPSQVLLPAIRRPGWPRGRGGEGSQRCCQGVVFRHALGGWPPATLLPAAAASGPSAKPSGGSFLLVHGSPSPPLSPANRAERPPTPAPKSALFAGLHARDAPHADGRGGRARRMQGPCPAAAGHRGRAAQGAASLASPPSPDGPTPKPRAHCREPVAHATRLRRLNGRTPPLSATAGF